MATNTQPDASRATTAWPALPLDEWRATQETLHRWTQIVGKLKLALTPFLNEWWNVALHLTGRGLTTGPMSYGDRSIEVSFDFVDHNLVIATSDGAVTTQSLAPRAVADFYNEFFAALRALGIEVAINPMPVEIADPVSFARDREHATYDADAAHRWWRVLLQTETVLQRYRAPFAAKSSPVLFYWGSFDLSATRFSGKPAPPLPAGTPRFFQLAEDQENIAVGFWPGNTSAAGVTLGEPAFYGYIFPEPDGFKAATVRPEAAFYHPRLGQFILPYEAARQTADPSSTILAFYQSVYEVAVTRAGWDRGALEHGYPEGAR